MSCIRKIRDKAGVVRRTYSRPKTAPCDCGRPDGVLLNTNQYECPRCSALRKQTSNRVSLSQRPSTVIPEYRTCLKFTTDPENWSCNK